MTESERERIPNLYSRQNRRPYHHVDGDAGLDFRATLTSRRCSSEPNWPWHTEARHFYLALPLQFFDVGCEWNIYFSACRRYTIDRGIPQIQNAQLDTRWNGKMHIVGKLFDWPSLLCCFVDRVDVFLGQVHRTLKASERFRQNLPVVSLYFACLLALVTSTTTVATFI